MQGVGPRTVLGDRYCLRHRLSGSRDLELWSANDATLRREVALILIGAEHPNKAGALDAARRAAGVEDARLVRILDVGSHNDNSFIVQEALNGSESLATILLKGPLPAEEARRVAGEAAKGLEAAGVRGLHHLRLTAHHVLVAPEGTIRVSGVAIAAAVEGPDEQGVDSEAALRRDAVALVAIVYAALTTRWPLEEKVSGLEPAPRMTMGAVAPSKIVAGVPDDLDTLCRLTLNESAGPLTPGVVANRIAPWSRERIYRASVAPTIVIHLPNSGDLGDGVPVVVASAEPTVGLSAHQVAPYDPTTGRTQPAKASGLRRPVTSVEPRETAPVQRGEVSAPTPSTVGDKTPAAGAAPTEALGTTLTSGDAATSVLTGEPGAFATGARRRGDPAAAKVGQAPRLAMGLYGKYEDLGLPVRLLPASTALPATRGQSKIVMVVVTAFVAIALFFGYRGLLGLSGPSPSTPTTRRAVTTTVPAPAVPAAPPKTAAASGAPIAILSATGFDPQGDQQENNSQAARVYDGNPATTWTSELYATPQFGNLKKGVGLLLDLGQPTSVHQISIDLANGPIDLTVYAATGPNLAGASVIGSASAANGRVQVKAATPNPEQSQYVIVWFTALAPEGSQFGASVSEIALN